MYIFKNFSFILNIILKSIYMPEADIKIYNLILV